jgi:asparagine synthase (glutamine-hydrolysing)
MLKLFGWIGTPGSRAALAAQYLGEAATSLPAAPEELGRVRSEGPGWLCIGPEVAFDEGIAVAFRGEPVWRTQEARITGSGSAARAVLEAYRLHGLKFLDLLHGAFALAVIDTRNRRTLLAVDRMGVERLCYARRQDEIWFSTSAEVVARAPDCAPRVSSQSVLSYLFFHMVPSPDTIFAGVSKLPPASALLIEDGRPATRITYWLPKFAANGSESADALAESLHTALTTAVGAARPDGTTGAFLSGGLDSSTVAGVLSKVTAPARARTYSIGFGFEEYDELRYARIAAQRFNLDSQEYEVQPDDIVEMFPAIAAAFDEPFGNASAMPTLCCARLARRNGVTHLLAGDGGDEIFAGNKRYAEQQIFERYNVLPGVMRTGLLEPALRVIPGPLSPRLVRKARSYIAQAKVPLPDRLESWNYLPRLGYESVLHTQFGASVDIEGPVRQMRAVFESAPPAALVDRMLYYDWHFTLADNDLRKVGTTCELAGVRVSYPMLHPDVIDVSLRVPAALKMRGTELRSFYKEAMADFLPAQIINKSKHGFGLPFGLWLERSQRLATLIDTNLAGLQQRNVIRPEFIAHLRKLHGQEDASYYGGFVWTLAMLEQWLREHRLEV